MSRQDQITAVKQKIERLKLHLEYLERIEELKNQQDQNVQTKGKE